MINAWPGVVPTGSVTVLAAAARLITGCWSVMFTVLTGTAPRPVPLVGPERVRTTVSLPSKSASDFRVRVRFLTMSAAWKVSREAGLKVKSKASALPPTK